MRGRKPKPTALKLIAVDRLPSGSTPERDR